MTQLLMVGVFRLSARQVIQVRALNSETLTSQILLKMLSVLKVLVLFLHLHRLRNGSKATVMHQLSLVGYITIHSIKVSVRTLPNQIRQKVMVLVTGSVAMVTQWLITII